MISRNIFSLRTHMGLTQEELAQKTESVRLDMENNPAWNAELEGCRAIIRQ